MREPAPFRFPANMPPLTCEGLTGVEQIGSTVIVKHFGGSCVIVLYGLMIAHVYPDKVAFPVTGDRHQATREWLTRVVRDNDIGFSVFRDRKSVLVIDGKLPVEGRTFANRPTAGGEIR